MNFTTQLARAERLNDSMLCVGLDPDPASDLARRAAHVDVLAFVATLGVPLEDGGPPTSCAELMGKCRSGDAGSRNDGVASHESCVPSQRLGHREWHGGFD